MSRFSLKLLGIVALVRWSSRGRRFPSVASTMCGENKQEI